MKTTLKLSVILFTASWFFAGWATFSTLAIEAANLGSFEVSGRADTAHSFQDGVPSGTNSRTFFFATDGRAIFIHCSAGTQDQGIEYDEFGTDGTDAFYFTKFLNPTGSASRRVANDSTMSIHPSPWTPRSRIEIQVQWLVYGAAGGLKEDQEKFLPPLGPIRLRETPFDSELVSKLHDNLLLRADWSLDDQPPHLLSRFVNYRDGKWGSRRYSASLIPDELMSGKTNSRLDILSWTNRAGLHIPVDAQLTSYLSNTNRTGGPLQVHFVHRLIATNVVAGTARRSFVPKLARATRVVDYRFATRLDQPAVYIATNGMILSTADDAWAEVQRQRDAAREREDRNRTR